MLSTITTDVTQHDLAKMQHLSGSSTMDSTFSLVAQYLDLQNQLIDMLHTVDPKIISEKCLLMSFSKQTNIPLFASDFLKVLRNSVSTTALLQNLAPFTNWMDHSILTTAVEACNVPEAIALITKFEAEIDTSQPVTKYPIPSPSHHMVPYDTSTHTVLAVQLNLQLHHSTLQNIIDTGVGSRNFY